MNCCPKCESSKVISIVYGMPASDLAEDEEKGKIVLGGCVIREGMPDYRCKECKYEWEDENYAERTCNTCGDVVMYCKCYEDVIKDIMDE
tara:strand:- start:1091 stop:1360 length:270 start_codon:yes stop_codon:yes gene_type:complete